MTTITRAHPVTVALSKVWVGDNRPLKAIVTAKQSTQRVLQN